MENQVQSSSTMEKRLCNILIAFAFILLMSTLTFYVLKDKGVILSTKNNCLVSAVKDEEEENSLTEISIRDSRVQSLMGNVNIRFCYISGLSSCKYENAFFEKDKFFVSEADTNLKMNIVNRKTVNSWTINYSSQGDSSYIEESVFKSAYEEIFGRGYKAQDYTGLCDQKVTYSNGIYKVTNGASACGDTQAINEGRVDEIYKAYEQDGNYYIDLKVAFLKAVWDNENGLTGGVIYSDVNEKNEIWRFDTVCDKTDTSECLDSYYELSDFNNYKDKASIYRFTFKKGDEFYPYFYSVEKIG